MTVSIHLIQIFFNSDCVRLVDASLVGWRELGLAPWLLPVGGRRRKCQREVIGPSEMVSCLLAQTPYFQVVSE